MQASSGDIPGPCEPLERGREGASGKEDMAENVTEILNAPLVSLSPRHGHSEKTQSENSPLVICITLSAVLSSGTGGGELRGGGVVLCGGG